MLRIRYIMPQDLEIYWDIIEMRSFQLRCWSTITRRNLALFTRCIASFCKITSFWGVRIFLQDNMIICVLFTLRVSLLESNHNATLANYILRISITLSIESFEHIPLCHRQKARKVRHYLSSQYHWCRLERFRSFFSVGSHFDGSGSSKLVCEFSWNIKSIGILSVVQYGNCFGVTIGFLTTLLRFWTNIFPCWLDFMYQQRSSVCVTRINLGLMINAGMLLTSSRWLIFGGPVIALGLTGKSLSAIKWELM